MKRKTAFFVFVALAAALLHVCEDYPADSASPQVACAMITLVSGSMNITDTLVVDSAGNEIGVIISYHLGYFIDSVYIGIYSADTHDSLDTLQPDSQMILRFSESDLRDTTRFPVVFRTAGVRCFTVTSYKRQGYVSRTTARAIIIGPDADSNHAPWFVAGAPGEVYRCDEGELVRFAVTASDSDSDSLEYSFRCNDVPLPREAQAALLDGFFSWQSAEGDKGIYQVTFYVTDGMESDSVVTTLVVGDTAFNTPPRITSAAPTTVFVDEIYEYRPIVTDYEDSLFIWELTGTRPEGMRFDSVTGRILWTPPPGAASAGPLTLRVTDHGTPPMCDSQEILISVLGINQPPVAQPRSVSADSGRGIDVELFASDPDDSVITFEVVEFPRHGTAEIKGVNLLQYVPEEGFKGVDTVWFRACDPNQCGEAAAVKIYVAMENQKPGAFSREIATPEDVALTFDLAAEDPEGMDLEFTILRNPRRGSLSGTKERRTYTPYADFFGNDTLIFLVNDGLLDSDPGTVIVTVSPLNDTPSVKEMGVPTAVNSPVTISLTVLDPDDSVFVWLFPRTPRHGSMDTSDLPTIVYTPHDDFAGNDTVICRVADAQACTSAAAAIVVVVGSDNNRPVALAQSLNTPEDTPILFGFRGEDVETSDLTFEVVFKPKYGTLSGVGADRTYTPMADFSGIDTITFTAGDGLLVSEAAAITITVEPINDPPFTQSQSVGTALNEPVTITLSAMDVDDSVFFFDITTGPLNGTLDTSDIHAGRIIYEPGHNYKGIDTLRFVARDAKGSVSREAIVAIAVAAINQRPVADPQHVSMNEDLTKAIFLSGSDIETSRLIFWIDTNPKHGALEGTLPNVSYVPNTNFSGRDTFWFKVYDGSLTSLPAAVDITVWPVNDAPIAMPRVASTGMDKSVSIKLKAMDVDDESFIYEVTDAPFHGVVDVSGISGGTVSYTPVAGYRGYDTLYYRAFDDGGLASAKASIIIGIGLGNQPPEAHAQSVTLREDEPKQFELKGYDPEGAPLEFVIVTGPRHGRLENSPPDIRYIPEENYFGLDTVSFFVNDGSFSSSPAIVDIRVDPVNDPPFGNPQLVTTGRSGPVTISLTGGDVDGDAIFFSVVENPAHGTLDTSAIAFGRVVYTPSGNFRGSDILYFVVRDPGNYKSGPTAVTIGVALDDQKPVAHQKIVATHEDSAITVALTGSDPEGAALTFSIADMPKLGGASISGSTLTYTPAADSNGFDTLEYYANDGLQNSDPAQILVAITAVNDSPRVNTTFPEVTEDTPTPFTLDVHDVDGDPLTFTLVESPEHGTISGTLPGGTYTPDGNFSGADAFVVTVSDGLVTVPPVTIAITVSGVNDTPVVASIPAQTVELDESFTPIPLDNYVDDPDHVDGEIAWTASGASHLGVVINAERVAVITALSETWTGSETIEFRATDPGGLFASGSVVFTVKSGSSPQIILSQTYMLINESGNTGPVGFTLSGWSAPPEELEVLALSDNTDLVSGEGTVITGSGLERTFTVTPLPGKSGNVTITLTASDGLEMASEDFFLTVNARPVANTPDVETDENVPVEITLGGTDPDNDGEQLRFTITKPPVMGTLSGVSLSGSVTYTPDGDSFGSDGFEYTVTDKYDFESAPASVVITINETDEE